MEKIPDSVFGFILGNLQQLVEYNYGLISGAEGNVEELCGYINSIKGFVEEYSKKRNHQNEFVKTITDELRVVVHKAEDIVETYIHSVSLHKSRSGLDKFRHEIGDLWSLRNVGEKINDLRGRMQEIYADKVPASLVAVLVDETSIRPPSIEKEEDASAVEDNVVGFVNEAHDVINLLKKESEQGEMNEELEQLPVVSITGMFGLGKTTLAKKILKDPRIHESFPDRAFVRVSQEFDKRKVFLAILDAFIEIAEEIKGMTDERLTKEVEKELKMRKYLIVLDDVWSKEAWNALQVAFPKQKGSVILLTSREVKVAYHANPPAAPYQLYPLTMDQSKDLLRKKAGLKSRNLDPALEYCVSNIAQKCKGLPLSIVVIAGILQFRQDKIYIWERVSNSVNAYVAKDPHHTSLIRLSYDILPFYLKQCFLYLGVFHECSEIPVWKLLRLWIAEGFVQEIENISLEDIAEDYLEDLVARNLVMVSQRKSNGQIKTCLVHDTLRSFCKIEAIKENLFRETKGDEATTVNPASASYRRLCTKPELLGYIFSKHSLEYVRSFLSFSKEETPSLSTPKDVSSISKGFKLLRVLDVKSITLPSFPDELVSLVLLKYIAISCTSNTLPEDMSNLLNLQTVIFETLSPTLEVKADIWKMLNLRHLHTNSSIVLPLSLSKNHQNQSLQSQKLQTLCTISSGCCRAEVFERTPNLNKLGIRGNLNMLFEARGESCLFSGISKYIQQVKNLKLVNEDTHSSLNVLNADSFPTMLTRLTLKNTRLNWEHMKTLGKLEFLQVLKLKNNAFRGEKLETREGGFLSLKVLYIGTTNLEEWNSSESHFPLLKCLIISDCNVLKAIPFDIGKIRSLQKIELYLCDTNSSLIDSAKKIEELKLLAEDTCGFKLSISNSTGKPNRVKATADILPSEEAIGKRTSDEVPLRQRQNSKESLDMNAQTSVPTKKSGKKGFGFLKKVKNIF